MSGWTGTGSVQSPRTNVREHCKSCNPSHASRAIPRLHLVHSKLLNSNLRNPMNSRGEDFAPPLEENPKAPIPQPVPEPARQLAALAPAKVHRVPSQEKPVAKPVKPMPGSNPAAAASRLRFRQAERLMGQLSQNGRKARPRGGHDSGSCRSTLSARRPYRCPATSATTWSTSSPSCWCCWEGVPREEAT